MNEYSRRKNLSIVLSRSGIEEHYVCHCSVFYEIRGTLCKVMENTNQWCQGLLLLELKRHKEKLLKDNNTVIQAHRQRTIITFFIHITPINACQSHKLLKGYTHGLPTRTSP